ncbi:hypothetical protein P7E02_12440 [Enterococcus hulanensis]|uniref:hypothetical protein n=1 Tax=Enterococcus hulanensis TaxID=2559929 RepID=UPI00288E4E45|nr:hypothetical protein [Enterococcus hulanensis]MDT2660683.1 hypothetical protein [Enterococcus hulanensis]
MEELSKMNQINNLAFDIMHETNQGKTFDCAADIYRLSLQAKLNENQQAVLSWLIDCYKDDGDPVEAISDLYDETMPTERKTCLDAAYETFDNQQKFQLLAAFAEWGMKEVAE